MAVDQNHGTLVNTKKAVKWMSFPQYGVNMYLCMHVLIPNQNLSVSGPKNISIHYSMLTHSQNDFCRPTSIQAHHVLQKAIDGHPRKRPRVFACDLSGISIHSDLKFLLS